LTGIDLPGVRGTVSDHYFYIVGAADLPPLQYLLLIFFGITPGISGPPYRFNDMARSRCISRLCFYFFVLIIFNQNVVVGAGQLVLSEVEGGPAPATTLIIPWV